MDDLSHQLELLFNQNSPQEASFPIDIEQPLPFIPPNNLSPPIPPPLVDQNTAILDTALSFPPMLFDPLRSTSNNHPAFAPTPILTLPPPCNVNFPPPPFSSEQQQPQQQQPYAPSPLMGYFGLNRMNRTNQMLCMDIRNTYDFQHQSYLNPSGDPMGPNWEAINAYLSGQVLQGSEDVRIFRCSICGVEFPNAQAFGGHMSSHSKTRRQKSLAPIKAQFKRVGGSTKTKSSVNKSEEMMKKKKKVESDNKGKELSKE